MSNLVIHLARKPLSESSVAKNVLKHGTGGINIGASRVGTEDTKRTQNPQHNTNLNPGVWQGGVTGSDAGRWPANLILVHPGCELAGTRKVKGSAQASGPTLSGRSHSPALAKGMTGTGPTACHVDECGLEEVDSWDCVDGCPVKALDEQTGPEFDAILRQLQQTDPEGYGHIKSAGGASRYFKQVQSEEELVEYLRLLLSPPSSWGSAIYLPCLEESHWEDICSWAPDSVPGVITQGMLTEAQARELVRVLRPGAHLALIAPEEQPTGHTGACRLEDAGLEIRDAFLWVREPTAFHYVAKAARKEREAGCQGLKGKSGASAVERKEGTAGLNSPRAGAGRTASHVKNFHPTCKPIEIMEALLWDVPLDAVVCDNFLGSGATAIACIRTGHDFLGIEREREYLEIADARVRYWNRGADIASDLSGGGDVSIGGKPDGELFDLFWEEDDPE